MADDFTKLARDLGDVPLNSGRNIRKATEVTARNIKDAWAGKLEGANHLPHGSRTITYDIKSEADLGGSSIEAEIGAQLHRLQARFVKVVENGAATLAPRGYGSAALQENEADFEAGLDKAISDALKESGL